MEEILDIFNDKLEIIGQDTRTNVHKKGLLHQVVHCWAIEDSKDGRFVYMQQRAEFKDFPLLFDIAVGGHIDAGEIVEDAMLREIKEEIGLDLKLQDLKYEGTIVRDTSSGDFLDKEICRIFTYTSHKAIKFNPGIEVKKMIKIREKEFIDVFLNKKEGLYIINLDDNSEEYKTKKDFCMFGREYETILKNRQ
ncbi:NUDIX hydrolase [Intestinibacter bartlettii]|uniref:NUDIX domain-containing protein n=2 Tax=Intestinibacter bartlettii TaxID=261299 RepID=A0ABS6DXT3_9FIRM|nr:NUDIX domain-containing protein [Intestinibacter bartlettii]MBU5336658.1 NUDIX domain-containing protein [Intestinibacter bartlettii]